MNNYKMKKGGSKSKFGMLSVKAGYDNNPKATAADRIVGATDKAEYGKIMSKGGPVKTLRAKSLRRCRKTK